MTQVERLEDQVFQLTEQVKELKAALIDTDWAPPARFKLTGSETIILQALRRREIVSVQALMLCLYRDRYGDEPECNVVRVLISHLRAKLRPFGIVVKNTHGLGYSLSPDDRQRLTAMSQVGP